MARCDVISALELFDSLRASAAGEPTNADCLRPEAPFEVPLPTPKKLLELFAVEVDDCVIDELQLIPELLKEEDKEAEKLKLVEFRPSRKAERRFAVAVAAAIETLPRC